MERKQKNTLAVHDISCVGRCSLTVALPIISAMGIETSCIPTAVLSTHTGGFTGFTYRDLTDDIIPVFEHWKTLGITFDSIYSGFLGSGKQIDILLKITNYYKKKGSLIIVDPVMADNGSLYKIFPADFPKGMARLCKNADIIIPNITEACLLVNEKYTQGPYTKEYIENLLKKLSLLAPKIVLTGVYFDINRLGIACYDVKTNEINYYFADKIEGYYHGTGDVFGSVITGAAVNKMPLPDACRLAVDFTVAAIKTTKKEGRDIKYGVNFEENLHLLTNYFKK